MRLLALLLCQCEKDEGPQQQDYCIILYYPQRSFSREDGKQRRWMILPSELTTIRDNHENTCWTKRRDLRGLASQRQRRLLPPSTLTPYSMLPCVLPLLIYVNSCPFFHPDAYINPVRICVDQLSCVSQYAAPSEQTVI